MKEGYNFVVDYTLFLQNVEILKIMYFVYLLRYVKFFIRILLRLMKFILILY